ncbi:FKBP-type peptidyl-prolyl cis-trans isomerase family protein [Klebsormidium nitens]|uniref:peptidylprolyl isomerase n=1 Tax=Klebsormidium nitens TaxID=105231 RepID=A0A1Y1I5X1_KLENI|nr:FKBP-type peptidyl-prolyl cis-trans isomerase family protein [Klebsormidium nitens]|eukprot:GAQ84551.1 FKBP-type peptidyl-prolyl cis-trans isomerase family protein [Klebsormidium nitens]
MVDDVDISGDGGVTKRILRRAKDGAAGPSSAEPLVDVQYEGKLEATGEVFDSSREDNTVFTFEVGQGKVIKAWDLAIPTMKVGELAAITCRSDYAYGDSGAPPDILGGATLVFEVELVAVRPPKGASAGSRTEERDKLEQLRKEREAAAAAKDEEKRKREEAKAAAAERMKAKLEGKKGGKKGGKK